MFLFILKMIILIYIVISIYLLINNQKYNLNGVVLEVENKEDFLNKINTLNPIKFKYNHNYNIENIPDNIIQDGEIVTLKKLYNLNNKSINIRKNSDIFYYNDNEFILSITNISPINTEAGRGLASFNSSAFPSTPKEPEPGLVQRTSIVSSSSTYLLPN